MEKSSIRPRDVVIHDFVQGWIDKAEDDLGLARLALSQGTRFMGGVAFHAQQAAEKYLKAFLTHNQVEFPKTHNLEELLHLVATVNTSLAASLRAVQPLSQFAVDTRYPSGPEPETVAEARDTVALAERVRRAVRQALGEPD